MTTFSIIIPSYNRAHLLSRCLNSVLAQSWLDFEVVLADDGSEDGTRELVTDYAARDRRIRYGRQENRGAGAARNLGASMAQGEYLLFLDSDDEVDSNWLAEFAEVRDSLHPAVICCGCRYINPEGRVIREHLPQTPGTGWRYADGFFFTGTHAIQKDVFENIGGYRSSLPANQHSELKFRLLPYCQRHGLRLACISKALVRRHEHGGPAIRGNLTGVLESGVFILTEYRSLFGDNRTGFASWAATVGCCAAKLGRYAEARHWFLQALFANPWSPRNYLRLGLALVPPIGRRVYRPTGLRVR